VAFEVALRWQRTLRKPPALLFVSGNRAPSNRRELETVHLADDAGLMDDVRKLGGTDLSILEGDLELMRLILPSIRSDYRAIELYEGPEDATLNCPIVALTADDDPTTSVEEMREWQRHTTRSFDLRVFTGGHFYLNDHQAEINDLLTERLATVGLPAI
jgi:surfactin synthase thioesterase subunit